jgi:hypothetical protein
MRLFAWSIYFGTVDGSDSWDVYEKVCDVYALMFIYLCWQYDSQSQWSRRLRHELSSPAQTLGP